MATARAGANRLMSMDDQPFGASLRALRWSIPYRSSGIGHTAPLTYALHLA